MPQITPHTYAVHIPDTEAMHPGGTHIYFVGDPAEGMAVVDTGEQERSWTRQILDYYRALGQPKITAILITHNHRDHTGGLDRLQEAFQAPVRCHPKLAKELGQLLGEEHVVPLRSRETLRTGGGAALRTYFTPGHSVDSVCYYLPQDYALFTGDTVLGGSSSTVSDLYAYMRSLALLAALKVDTICPGHGPVVSPPRGRQLIASYIDHRNQREAQVMAALEKGISGVEDMVRDIYPRNLKRNLRRAAAGNVRTHLGKLVKEKRAVASEIAYTPVQK